jgi:hypothetical protein
MSEPTDFPAERPEAYPAPVTADRRGRWIAPLALVISLLAAGAAGWTLARPAPHADAPQADAPNISSDPKGQVCSAFSTVGAAVYRYTNVTLPADLGPTLPAAQEAIAANARLAMAGGSAYLLRNLPPNAAADLSSEVRDFAGTLDTIAMKLLAGVPDTDPELKNLLKSADDANKRIAELCK